MLTRIPRTRSDPAEVPARRRRREWRSRFVVIFLGGVILFPMLRMPKPIAVLLALAMASWVTWLSLNLSESGDDGPRPRRKPTAPEDTMNRDEPPY